MLLFFFNIYFYLIDIIYKYNKLLLIWQKCMIIYLRDNYSKPTWGKALRFAYPWFKTYHFAHLNFNPLPIRYPPYPQPLEKHIFREK